MVRHRPRGGGGSVIAALFILTMLVPTAAHFTVGTLSLSAHRVLLLLAFFPCAGWLLTGRAGRLRACDVLVAAHSAWAVLSFAVNGGPDIALKSGGIYVVETLGAYLIGRTCIRDERAFRTLVRCLVWAVIGLAVFTVPEAITGFHYFAAKTEMGVVGPDDVRHGFYRAHGPFQHAILNGVFCSTVLAMAWYSVRGGRWTLRGLRNSLLICVSAATSVSSVVIVSLAAQGGLIVWNRLLRAFRYRWWLLAGMTAAAWLGISLASNRGAMAILARIAFDPQTAYMRQAIWQAGVPNVLAHPLFGLGQRDWVRPGWMPPSVDNFYLLTTMRYGVPALLLLGGAVLSCAIAGRRGRLPLPVQRLRTGWRISLVAFLISAGTVHLWLTALTFFFFFLGCGVWFADVPAVRAVRRRLIRTTCSADDEPLGGANHGWGRLAAMDGNDPPLTARTELH